ncbi:MULTISPECIES: acyltransferase [unclassified Pseudomonas]|uniref:acyltransferase family protein n=1 Tax=unclassified Pseudomonas TaxID=196821 RepID=UPI000C88D4F4|nr:MULTISPECIES: acyltransferase [unclassified Pseudomonas]PMZ93578.1 acyltransferase [Pseudomonas sp. FW305-42]PNA24660.1 acyltransferase [Pseudomonas sp. MPR-R1B]PNB22720.1 acyltransferase [Pseudomonas sp. DP16D-E2]PNB43231.1 acyltransferase [Pseudomonas sp. FW305-17]PNB57280.1 acyltransferase [Pseudomonas sp. GW531-E2]
MGSKLSALTSLRFFGALLVFVSHLNFLRQSDSVVVSDFYGDYMYEGYIGVTFFFVLSGFILAYANHGKVFSYGEYLFSRAARIYPLHLLTLLASIAVLAAVGGGPSSVWKYVSSLLLNVSLFQALSAKASVYFSFNAPSWSLSVELFFYILFPFLISFGTRALVGVVVSIVLLKCALALWGGEALEHFLFYIFPPLRLADFLVGILLFRLYVGGPVYTSGQASFCQASSLLVLVAFFSLGKFIPQSYRFDIYYLLPMAYLVFSFAHQQGVLAQAISSRLLVLLGEASFAFYLVHQLVIIVGQELRLRLNSDHAVLTDAGFAVVYFVVSLVLSIFLFKYYETPARMKMISLWRRRRWGMAV